MCWGHFAPVQMTVVLLLLFALYQDRHTLLGLLSALGDSQRLTGFARDAARGLCSRGLGAETQIHCLKTMCDPVGKVGEGQCCDIRPGEM